MCSFPIHTAGWESHRRYVLLFQLPGHRCLPGSAFTIYDGNAAMSQPSSAFLLLRSVGSKGLREWGKENGDLHSEQTQKALCAEWLQDGSLL